MPNAAPPREDDPEHVEGPSLAEAGRHTDADLRRLAVRTATALATAHQAGIVHRNLTPANVLLGEDGPRIIGFGLAHTADTPAYLAPEQLTSSAVGPAADVFAWGCVIASAATGTPPFGDDSVPAVTGRILYAEPWLGDLPEPLRSVVHDCLAKDPADRPAMREVLVRLVAGPQPVRRPVRAPLIAVAVVVALSASAAVIWNAPSTGGMGTPELAAHAGESPTVPQGTTGDRTPRAFATTHPRKRASFSLAHVRVRGSSKINEEGVACYTGSMNVGVEIDATKPAAPYSYQWIQDGKVIESGSSRMPSGSRSDYVAARRMLRPQDGKHRVTFRITSPVAKAESVTFAMCRP
jgi:serine/threonine protein kinase